MKSTQPLHWRANPGPARPSGGRLGGWSGAGWDQLAGPAHRMLSFDAGDGVFRCGRGASAPLDVMGEHVLSRGAPCGVANSRIV